MIPPTVPTASDVPAPLPRSSPSARAAVMLALAASLTAGSIGCGWFGGDKGPERVRAGEMYKPSLEPARATVFTAPQETPEASQAAPNAAATPAGGNTSVTVTPAGPSADAPATTVTNPTTPTNPATTANPVTAAAPPAPPTPAAAPVTPDTELTSRLPAPAPQPAAAATPAPAPVRVAPVLTDGTFMTLGGVLSEVNGVPIFATRVMRELEPVFAARARELDDRRFIAEARQLIERQVREFESEELEYATAQRSLDTDDKRLADNLTTDWRQKKILEAGGSLELARRRAVEQGNNFDEIVAQRSRFFLIQIYYQKKVLPRVQVTTNDMRRFYAANEQRMFTEATSATFRLIRIDPARRGGKPAALEKIRELRETLAKDPSKFAETAKTTNDDAALARNSGLVGPVAKGALAFEKVDEAVFRTDPGQLTEIIEDRGGFYIALVEDRKAGSTRPFDDPAVQEKVRDELRKVQVARMREQIRGELLKNAIVRRDPKMLQTALDMAQQRYPIWRAAGS